MGARSVLKSLKEFSKKELEEKKANRIRVQRIKMKSTMRRGKFPNLRVKKIEGSHYLVCVFHNSRMRVYYFSKNGEMLGADDFTGEEKESTLENISKETKNVFRFPAKQSQ